MRVIVRRNLIGVNGFISGSPFAAFVLIGGKNTAREGTRPTVRVLRVFRG